MLQTNEIGDFVPTTNVWVDRLHQIEVTSPEFKQLMVDLYQNINNIAISLNSRDSGYYPITQFINGQLFFPNPEYTTSTNTQVLRQVFRQVVICGALPNATTKSVAHGIDINEAYTFTRIYGCATDPINLLYVPLPYASNTANDNIELSVDATNVVITTASDWTAYTITNVVLEWVTQ